MLRSAWRLSLIALWAISDAQRAVSVGVSNVGYQGNVVDAVPSFIIIGTAKGGTTDLYAQLVEDAVGRDSARPESSIARSIHKELDFLTQFTLQDLGQLLPGSPKYTEYLQRLGHPCANASAATPDDIKACVRQRGLQHFTLDATPTYLFSAIAPLALAAISTQTKVIAMLRDPVERAQMLFRHFFLDEGRWADRTLDELVDAFLAFLREHPTAHAALADLRRCTDVRCQAAGWQNVSSAGLLDPEETKLFAGGLYTYALAAWRLHYLKPGRFMLIDSHTYFRNRTAVMEQVTHFLYGRGMTVSEQAAAAGEGFQRKDSSTVGRAGHRWILSAGHRAKLLHLYAEHGMYSLNTLIDGLRAEGAWVVGFDGAPWVEPSAPVAPKLLK